MTRYFIPSPCSVFPDVLAAQAIQPGSASLVSEETTAERMKEFFFPDAECVCFFPGVRGTLYQMSLEWLKDRSLLLIVNGPMSQEWLAVARDSRIELTVLDSPSGDSLSLNQLHAAFQTQSFDAVLAVETDIYTGASLDIEKIGALIRAYQPDTLFAVDCSASIFSVRMCSLERCVDMYLSCSDIAMGLPSGMILAALSPRAYTRLLANEFSLWLFDFGKAAVGRRDKRFYPAAPFQLINALNAQIDRILLEGLDARIARTLRIRTMLRDWMTRHGFDPGAAPGAEAVNITSVKLPPQFTPEPFISYLNEYGILIALGRGDISNSVLIAHGNDVTEEDMSVLLRTMERFTADYDTRGVHRSFVTPFKEKLFHQKRDDSETRL